MLFPVEPSSTESFFRLGVKAWKLERSELAKHGEVSWLTGRELCEDQMPWHGTSKPAKAGDKIEAGSPIPTLNQWFPVSIIIISITMLKNRSHISIKMCSG